MNRSCKEKHLRYSKPVKRRRNVLNEECKGLSPRFCRNPFMVFLEHFRKRLSNSFSSYESAVVAAEAWKHMDSNQKRPYIKFATNYQYTYKPKRSKVLYVVNTIRELVNDKCVDLHTLWRLCERMGSWNDSIMDILFCMDDELNECLDEESSMSILN